MYNDSAEKIAKAVHVVSMALYTAVVIASIWLGIDLSIAHKVPREWWLWELVAPDVDLYLFLNPLVDVLFGLIVAGVIAAVGCTVVWALTLPFTKKSAKKA